MTLLLLALLLPALQDDPQVFVVSSLDRVRPQDVPGTLREARLEAARNEVEGVQVVLRAGKAPLKGVQVEADPLEGPGGRLPVSLFREHYVEVKEPSPRSAEGAGAYPDALIPPLDTALPQPPRYLAFPFDLPAGSNQPIYVEVAVPKNALPGVYAGEIRFRLGGAGELRVPIRLEVWDFALPDAPSLRTNFGGLGRRLQLGHPIKHGTPAFNDLERRYAETLSRHRLNPPLPVQIRPLPGPDGSISPGYDAKPLRDWIRELHVTGIELTLIDEDPAGKDRARNAAYLRSLEVLFRKEGWDRMTWVKLFDEPKSAQDYEEVRRRARLVREAAPAFRTSCTEQPLPSEAAWGTLEGSVDLWVPFWSEFDAASAQARRKAGEQVWSATAYCQGPPDRPTPFWQLDFPLLNYRIAPWTTRALSLDGLHYWTLVYWPEARDVWTNPRTFQAFNGEGVLLYPGLPAGIHGPVTTLRLKALRDGLEDYEYLILAGAAAAEPLASIARSWTDWERDPRRLLEARRALARIILGAR
jgi:hypothetical protein